MLKDLCTGHIDYGHTASGKEIGRYRYARITDIDPLGRMKKKDMCYVDTGQEKILRKNDLVIARTGTQAGKAYLYDPKDGELVFASFLIRFHLDPEKVIPSFIKYYMLSDAYKKWAEKTASGILEMGLILKRCPKCRYQICPWLHKKILLEKWMHYIGHWKYRRIQLNCWKSMHRMFLIICRTDCRQKGN